MLTDTPSINLVQEMSFESIIAQVECTERATSGPQDSENVLHVTFYPLKPQATAVLDHVNSQPVTFYPDKKYNSF